MYFWTKTVGLCPLKLSRIRPPQVQTTSLKAVDTIGLKIIFSIKPCLVTSNGERLIL